MWTMIYKLGGMAIPITEVDEKERNGNYIIPSLFIVYILLKCSTLRTSRGGIGAISDADHIICITFTQFM
jgi:hypothetical protein